MDVRCGYHDGYRLPQEKEDAMAKFRADRVARASKAQEDSGVEGKENSGHVRFGSLFPFGGAAMGHSPFLGVSPRSA